MSMLMLDLKFNSYILLTGLTNRWSSQFVNSCKYINQRQIHMCNFSFSRLKPEITIRVDVSNSKLSQFQFSRQNSLSPSQSTLKKWKWKWLLTQFLVDIFSRWIHKYKQEMILSISIYKSYDGMKCDLA